MKSHRRLLTIALALLPVLGASCTSSDPNENSPPLPATMEQPSLGLGKVDDPAVDLTGITDLLSCKPQKYITISKTIDKKGGEIRFGTHILVIPKDAISAKVTITAEQMPGNRNTARFRPEGLRFSRAARLTMSYDNCARIKQKKVIVYTDELLKVLQRLPGEDNARDGTVTTSLDHFSRYAVAF
jgi:hypothetical protein